MLTYQLISLLFPSMAATIDQLQKIVTRNRVVAIVLDFSAVSSVDYTGARVSLALFPAVSWLLTGCCVY